MLVFDLATCHLGSRLFQAVFSAIWQCFHAIDTLSLSFSQIKSIYPNQTKSYWFLPISSNLPASGYTWTIFRRFSLFLLSAQNTTQTKLMCPLKMHEYSKNRTGAPPASCGAQPTWKTPSVTCYFREQIFPGTVYHSWQKWLLQRSGGVCNAAIQLFRQNLTKINEAKGNKTKQKKSTQGFFSSTYL